MNTIGISGSCLPNRHRFVPALLAALLALSASSAYGAIAVVVVPEEAADSPGNGGTIFPFGATAECTDGLRFQQVIDGSEIGSGNISGVAFRLDDGESDFGPHTYGDTTIKLSSTSRSSGNLSETFSDNIGEDETLVFEGDMTVEASAGSGSTNPFDFRFPIEVPFQFDGSSDNLLLDVTVEDCPDGADGVFFDSDTRDVHDVYAFDKDAATAEPSSGAGGMVTEITLSSPPPTPPLYDCPFNSGSGGGDGLDRGFYVENFPGRRLDEVTLEYLPGSSGAYTIELTAREGGYDGRLIGSRRVSFNAGGSDDAIRWTYDFGGATVTEGAVVAFSHEVIEQAGSIFYDTASDSGGCADITQTNGTTAPLDTERRDSVGLRIESVNRLRGLGSNWTVVDHNGEGFMIDFTDRGEIVAIWFTYDDAGNQKWLLGASDQIVNNQVTMGLTEVTGPVFGPDFDPADVVTEDWGTISITFDDCRSGTVHFNSTTGFGSGVYEIAKLYGTEQEICQ